MVFFANSFDQNLAGPQRAPKTSNFSNGLRTVRGPIGANLLWSLSVWCRSVSHEKQVSEHFVVWPKIEIWIKACVCKVNVLNESQSDRSYRRSWRPREIKHADSAADHNVIKGRCPFWPKRDRVASLWIPMIASSRYENRRVTALSYPETLVYNCPDFVKQFQSLLYAMEKYRNVILKKKKKPCNRTQNEHYA